MGKIYAEFETIGYRDRLCWPKWITISGKPWLRQFPFTLVQLPPPSNASHLTYLLTRYIMFEILLDSIKMLYIIFLRFVLGRALPYHFSTIKSTFTIIPKELQHYIFTNRFAAGVVGRSIPKDLQHRNLMNEFAAGFVGRSISIMRSNTHLFHSLRSSRQLVATFYHHQHQRNLRPIHPQKYRLVLAVNG